MNGPRLSDRATGFRATALLDGRFERVDVLGRGGMSVVYRAIDHAWPGTPDVALKVVEAVDEGRRAAAALLHREGSYLHRIRHRHIVRAQAAGCDGALHFLALEWLRGETLAQILRRQEGRAFSPAIALPILAQLGDALAAIHRGGLIHGDVKPGNVFITRDGCVKLIDFGLAQPILPAEPEGEKDASTICPRRIGAVTPAYASPGMLAGLPPDPADDVFSFATLAYVILAGAHPFDGQPAHAYSCIPACPPGLTEARWAILRRGLSPESGARPADVRGFANQLCRTDLSEKCRALKEAARRSAARSIFAAGPWIRIAATDP